MRAENSNNGREVVHSILKFGSLLHFYDAELRSPTIRLFFMKKKPSESSPFYT